MLGAMFSTAVAVAMMPVAATRHVAEVVPWTV